MAYADPLDERSSASKRKHYQNNKEQYYRRNKTRKLEIRAYLDEVKSKPCVDCGLSFPPYAMDLDHRPDENKSCDPARLVSSGSWKVVYAEVAKCDLVCAICHRKRTHARICDGCTHCE